ncbi:MAG: hypothetical protein K0R29_1024 [Pseudobdellovibrio sp.]|jgi:hypothetical protein|nr:hypothetical protein [Pseudobdellovibrio sp.]
MMQTAAFIENPITETLERLRANSNLNSTDWFDLVGISFSDYIDLKLNSKSLPEKSVESLSKYFSLQPEQIITGQINFKDLTLKMEHGSKELPEIYGKAAFGRQRTSITSLDFVEHFGGWRLRHDSIKKLGVTENSMLNPFAPISMKFITDLCSYLSLRQLQKKDFYEMGAFSFVSNRSSVLGKILAEMPDSNSAYDLFFAECMKLLQRNYLYSITKRSKDHLTVEYVTDSEVGAESGVRHLGSQHVCQIQAGFISTIPMYLGLPAADVTKSSCVHCGDAVCTLQIDLTEANAAQATRSF